VDEKDGSNLNRGEDEKTELIEAGQQPEKDQLADLRLRGG
jgi:hypothetical protein